PRSAPNISTRFNPPYSAPTADNGLMGRRKSPNTPTAPGVLRPALQRLVAILAEVAVDEFLREGHGETRVSTPVAHGVPRGAHRPKEQ
ncbi:hypothetical protein MYX04_13550, partial [Nitrospiraceae bacterium AH_259_D15_M11_P09]|nr:hypothetical protein [Nitrospiraceae bacterium AH_259_D15_M11_P09]